MIAPNCRSGSHGRRTKRQFFELIFEFDVPTHPYNTLNLHRLNDRDTTDTNPHRH